MVAEARLESTEDGLVPVGEGWFVLNAREARWWDRKGRGVLCEFEGYGLEDALDFTQLGINITILGPGEPMGMYHRENDQEDFLVLSGEALLIVEARSARSGRGTSRTARQGRSTRSSAPETRPA
jgi:uncharacterized cupin superfamily protein